MAWEYSISADVTETRYGFDTVSRAPQEACGGDGARRWPPTGAVVAHGCRRHAGRKPNVVGLEVLAVVHLQSDVQRGNVNAVGPVAGELVV